MKQKKKMARGWSCRPEGLESRGLLTAGVSAGLIAVEDLGEVSRALAIKGVEVTAPIASHGSITFRFDVEAAGDYTLKVRYSGGALELEARGPSGSSSITPGPAGPFSTIALPLRAASYEITASAVDDRPVFVDWELLLNSGVGQGAAVGTTLAAPAVAIPPPSAPGPVASSTVTTPPPSSSATDWTPAVSSSMIATGGLVGRPDRLRAITPVGPTTPDGSLALAYAGDGLPEGALSSLAQVARGDEPSTPGEPTSLLALEALGDAAPDLAALAAPSWLDRLVERQGPPTPGPANGPGGPDSRARPADSDGRAGEAIPVVAVADDPFGPESDRKTVASASPGLITGVVAMVTVGRRWRPGLPGLRKRPALQSKEGFFPLSMG